MDGKLLYEYVWEGKFIFWEIKGWEVEVLEVEFVEWYEFGKYNYCWFVEEVEVVECNFVE